MKKTIILCLASATVLTACTVAELDEKQAYIDSTIEVGCLTNFNPLNTADVKKADDIWINNGIELDRIVEVTNTYKNDDEVLNDILAGIRKCNDLSGATAPVSTATDTTETVDTPKIIIENQTEGTKSKR